MKMVRNSGRVLSTALAVAASVIAISAVTAPGATAQDDKFISLDKNRDGYLSRQEFNGAPGNDRAAFERADQNRDGRLSPQEFVTRDAGMSADRGKADRAKDNRNQAGEYVEDSLITAKVKAALLRAPELKSLDVSVETDHGTVMLTGVVQNRNQRDRAIKVASLVEGVADVKDGLAVR